MKERDNALLVAYYKKMIYILFNRKWVVVFYTLPTNLKATLICSASVKRS